MVGIYRGSAGGKRLAAGFTWTEWQDAQSNIRDLERMRRLGLGMYQAFWGNPRVPEEAWVKDLIAAFARLLDLSFARMDRNLRRQLRRHMLGRGRFREPNLLEDINRGLESHRLLNAEIDRGGRPTLLELLLMAHDLEAYVRPNLRRFLWVARMSNPKVRIPYPQAQLTAAGEQASLGLTLINLGRWVRGPASAVFPKAERRALGQLVSSFKSSARDQIDLDSLRNWVDHRDFIIEDRCVLLHLHRRRNDRKRLRMIRSREEVTDMRLQLRGLIALLKAFEGMFRVHEATPPMAYRRRPRPLAKT